MNFTGRVQKYIQVGNIDDLQWMSELAFEITVEMNKFLEEWKVTSHNQDLARLAWYKKRKWKKRKDGKEFTDTQADRLGKEEALMSFDYTDYELWYRRLKSLLDRLLERKIEVQTMNKLQKELSANAR